MVNVFEHDGAVGGSVGDPQLFAVRDVVGRKEQLCSECCEFTGIGSVGSGSDVFEHDGVVGGSVGDPQLVTVDSVVGHEIDLAFEHCHGVRVRTIRTSPDLFEHGGSVGGSVGDPQFAATCCGGGLEQHLAVQDRSECWVTAIRAAVDVEQQIEGAVRGGHRLGAQVSGRVRTAGIARHHQRAGENQTRPQQFRLHDFRPPASQVFMSPILT